MGDQMARNDTGAGTGTGTAVKTRQLFRSKHNTDTFLCDIGEDGEVVAAFGPLTADTHWTSLEEIRTTTSGDVSEWLEPIPRR